MQSIVELSEVNPLLEDGEQKPEARQRLASMIKKPGVNKLSKPRVKTRSDEISRICSVNPDREGSETLAVNNTRARRFWTRLALRTTAKFYSRDGLCVPISQHKIVKTGFRTHLTEGATLEYLLKHISIPVPKVHCSFIPRKRAYLVMERMRGDPLPRSSRHCHKKRLAASSHNERGSFRNLAHTKHRR